MALYAWLAKGSMNRFELCHELYVQAIFSNPVDNVNSAGLQGSLEIEGIVGLWSLKSSIGEALDTFLVVSFISETRILAMNCENELEETEIKGFLSQVRTLFCHDAVYNQLVQVFDSCYLCLFHYYFLWNINFLLWTRSRQVPLG